MFPYDTALLEALRLNPTTIDEVVQIQEAIDIACGACDGLKWFNWLYLNVTEAVQARATDGGAEAFNNPGWVASLDVVFARYYFDAVRKALVGEQAPGCWQAFFDQRGNRDVARIQFALAGMNAHINHDLPLAVVEATDAAGIKLAHGTPEYADFTALNSTLDGLVQTAKEKLKVRLPGDGLPPVSSLEDRVAAWSLSAARETAWNNAELLEYLKNEAVLRTSLMAGIDGLTALSSKTLLVPVA